jgi:hypothetical protein
VTGVLEVGRRLEIEVELVARAACGRWCGRASVAVKDRPVVRVRELPVASRVRVLRWRTTWLRLRAEGDEIGNLLAVGGPGWWSEPSRRSAR